jgi:hypothetical protein
VTPVIGSGFQERAFGSSHSNSIDEATKRTDWVSGLPSSPTVATRNFTSTLDSNLKARGKVTEPWTQLESSRQFLRVVPLVREVKGKLGRRL